ncbi:MAG: ethanolamine utilization protein EutH [Clostridiales bacterium]|nr:ethanolamine utilization protein EutH [Clostridiales bacterium]
MNALTYVMLGFSLLGALDRMLGNRFGLGKEFEKGIELLGTLALSMIGMIVLAPWLAKLMQPLFSFMVNSLGIEPSIIPASIFANDMGGSALAAEVAVNKELGHFNALVIAAMMGATVSFNIPYAMSAVKKNQHRELLLGLLCGIVTIPVGSYFTGLLMGLPPIALLINLLPLILFSAIIALGLVKKPDLCVKIFGIVGMGIKILITFGLALAILRFLTGIEILPGLATLEEGAEICLNAAVIMTGAFPLLYAVSKLLKKPMQKLSQKMGINESSMMGFVSTLASSVTTFEMMKDMDQKGVMLNAAFVVSASFVLADHLAFTMAFNATYIFPMILAKFMAGFMALGVALVLYKRQEKAV